LDNINYLKTNLEKRFLLDHLTVDFEGESVFASGKVLSANYLVPMLLLSEYYQSTGEKEKLARWEILIKKLAEEHGKGLVVDNFLKREKGAPPFVPANLNVKALEGSLRHVKDNIYALKNEVTNDDYNFFLKYLITNKRDDVYERSNIDLSQYTEPALSFMKGYHSRPLTKKDKAGYPAINIPYEGVVSYCEWLTEQYNNDSKRKYKKVKFRLPSINEWQIAALGYAKVQSWILDENMVEMSIPKNAQDEICKGCDTKTYSMKESGILYPWYKHFNYRNKPLNKFGCALGNFKWPESQKPCRPDMTSTPDGFMMMAFVEAYFPNDIGLYDVVGNVAEMTSEKGKACGGSWNHSPEESTIRSINEYKGPDAAVGFRVFMEVIEN
jgi:formylglycine-generating enzyme required for sulfatase activity